MCAAQWSETPGRAVEEWIWEEATIYDGLDPEDYPDDDDADWWVTSSRFGTVLAAGFGLLVTVLVVAQVVIAMRR